MSAVNKEYEAELAAAQRDEHAARLRQLRREAYQLLDANDKEQGDLQSAITTWWQSQPAQYQQQALDTLSDVIDKQQTEQKDAGRL